VHQGLLQIKQNCCRNLSHVELYCRRENSEENWKNLIDFLSSKVEDNNLWDIHLPANPT